MGQTARMQAAFGWAERTPWALYRRADEAGSPDPRLRVLVAEVQVRCGGGLVPEDAGPQTVLLTGLTAGGGESEAVTVVATGGQMAENVVAVVPGAQILFAGAMCSFGATPLCWQGDPAR